MATDVTDAHEIQAQCNSLLYNREQHARVELDPGNGVLVLRMLSDEALLLVPISRVHLEILPDGWILHALNMLGQGSTEKEIFVTVGCRVL